MVNLHDVRRCPTGARCECCGEETPPLRTISVDIPAPLDGVICLTACSRCADGMGSLPPAHAAATISAATAARLVEQHCAHLHIGVEEMRAVLRPMLSSARRPRLA